jgi:hypothetical protein
MISPIANVILGCHAKLQGVLGADIIRYARREAKRFAAARPEVFARGCRPEIGNKFSGTNWNNLAAILPKQAL